jgi:hypothetical protein
LLHDSEYGFWRELMLPRLHAAERYIFARTCRGAYGIVRAAADALAPMTRVDACAYVAATTNVAVRAFFGNSVDRCSPAFAYFTARDAAENDALAYCDALARSASADMQAAIAPYVWRGFVHAARMRGLEHLFRTWPMIAAAVETNEYEDGSCRPFAATPCTALASLNMAFFDQLFPSESPYQPAWASRALGDKWASHQDERQVLAAAFELGVPAVLDHVLHRAPFPPGEQTTAEIFADDLRSAAAVPAISALDPDDLWSSALVHGSLPMLQWLCAYRRAHADDAAVLAGLRPPPYVLRWVYAYLYRAHQRGGAPIDTATLEALTELGLLPPEPDAAEARHLVVSFAAYGATPACLAALVERWDAPQHGRMVWPARTAALVQLYAPRGSRAYLDVHHWLAEDEKVPVVSPETYKAYWTELCSERIEARAAVVELLDDNDDDDDDDGRPDRDDIDPDADAFLPMAASFVFGARAGDDPVLRVLWHECDDFYIWYMRDPVALMIGTRTPTDSALEAEYLRGCDVPSERPYDCANALWLS